MLYTNFRIVLTSGVLGTEQRGKDGDEWSVSQIKKFLRLETNIIYARPSDGY